MLVNQSTTMVGMVTLQQHTNHSATNARCTLYNAIRIGGLRGISTVKVLLMMIGSSKYSKRWISWTNYSGSEDGPRCWHGIKVVKAQITHSVQLWWLHATQTGSHQWHNVGSLANMAGHNSVWPWYISMIWKYFDLFTVGSVSADDITWSDERLTYSFSILLGPHSTTRCKVWGSLECGLAHLIYYSWITHGYIMYKVGRVS